MEGWGVGVGEIQGIFVWMEDLTPISFLSHQILLNPAVLLDQILEHLLCLQVAPSTTCCQIPAQPHTVIHWVPTALGSLVSPWG